MKSLRYHLLWIGIVIVSLSMVGCEESADSGGSEMDNLAAQLEQNKQAAAAAAAVEQEKAAKAAEAAAAKAAADQAATEKAAADAVGAPGEESEITITMKVKNPQGLMKGIDPKNLDGKTTAGAATVGEGGGYYSAIAGAHRHITTRVDDLAWTQAVQHFWATNGRYPRTHEEFMRDVIEAQGIPLPELEEGQEYLYVPGEGQIGTLYVVEPQTAEQSPPASE